MFSFFTNDDDADDDDAELLALFKTSGENSCPDPYSTVTAPDVPNMLSDVGFDEKPADDGSIGDSACSPPTAYATTTMSSFMSLDSIHNLANDEDNANKVMCKRQKKANTKTYGGARFAIICPNDICVQRNNTKVFEALGGTGGSREGYHCQPDEGGCNNRWSQRTYHQDEVTEKFGTDDPMVRSCAKKSYREKKLGIQPVFKSIISKGDGTCLRTIGCPKPNGHKGKCSTRCCTTSPRTPDFVFQTPAAQAFETSQSEVLTEVDTPDLMPEVFSARVLRIIDDDDTAFADYFN